MRDLLVASVVTLALAYPVRLAAQELQTATVPPPRAGLLDVPLPRLDTLEPVVADQIREQQQALLLLTQGDATSNSRLADGYGRIGQLFHVYEFFDSAETAYLNAVRLAPNDAAWPHLLGYLYQQTGRLEAAADRFEQALRVQPDDRAAIVRLGQVYLGLNRLREAREQFQSVADVFPMLSRNGLGEVALRERRYDEAASHFRAVLERVPQATSTHYSLAMAYRGQGRMSEARSELEKRGPGGLNVGDPIVDELQDLVRGERGLVVRGRRAYEAGQFEQAAAAFAKALEAEPDSVTALANLGLAEWQLGRTTDAAARFEAALRLDSANLVAHSSLGLLLVEQGRDSESVAHLQAAFKQAPNDVNVRRELLAVLLRLRRHDEAIGVLTALRTESGDDEETLVSLAILLAERNRFGEAIGLLDEANQRFPDRMATATTLARLLASAPDRTVRNGSRALELASKVYGTEPSPVHRETVALALAELSRCDEALTWMRRAVAEAERENDAAEADRLRGELPKYDRAPCKQ